MHMSRQANKWADFTVLGVDPGLASTGWGVVLKAQGSASEDGQARFKAQGWGVIKTDPGLTREGRLEIVYSELQTVIKKCQPDLVAIEEVYFGKNAKTAMMVGQAQGVAMLAASSLGIKVCLLSPLQVKNAVVGYGRAEKAQVQELVKKQLGMQELPKPNHAADGLAVALTALVTNFELK